MMFDTKRILQFLRDMRKHRQRIILSTVIIILFLIILELGVQYNKVNETLSGLQYNFTHLQHENADIQKQYLDLQSDYNKLQNELDALQARIEILQNENASLTQENETLKADKAALEAKTAEQTQQAQPTQTSSSGGNGGHFVFGNSSSNTDPSISGDTMVWIPYTGSKYHSIPDCGNMNPNKARQMSKSSAEAQGYDACSKCW